MATWGTEALASALPPMGNAPVLEITEAAAHKTPQAHGWSAPVAVDYDKYAKTGQASGDLPQSSTAVDVNITDEAATKWAVNAPRYEYKEEYGDVPPRIPQMELMLFGPNKSDVAPALHWKGIMQISVTQEGPVRIAPVKSFEDAGLHPAMLDNVKLCGYTTPTPIQRYVLPTVFKGHDIMACAQTGSGKTAAYLVPVLSKFMGKAKKLCADRPNPAVYDWKRDGPVRAEPLILILSPTRELATQIFNEARRLCYRTQLRPGVVYGGSPVVESLKQLSLGCDLLVATPGRLIDLLGRPSVLTLRRLRYMVIDEADEMLHADWETEFKKIMFGGDQERDNVTYLMFSATFPKSVRELAREYLNAEHVRIRVGRIGSSHENITQDIVYVEQSMKREALWDLLMSKPPARTLIFVNSKRAADELDDFLYNKAMPCASLHSGRSQLEREDIIRAFRKGNIPILISTNVSARGIDVPLIAHVINYELPSHTHGGIEEYTHRIGRTGRSGRKGTATSFYSSRDADLAPALTMTLCETHQAVPDFLEEYLPNGFTADGQGDVGTLHFDADSDNGEDEGEATENADAADGWGGNNSAGDSAPAPTWNSGEVAPEPTNNTTATKMPAAPTGASSWEVQQNEVPIPVLQPTQSPAHVRFAPTPTILPTERPFAGNNTQVQTPGLSGPVAPHLGGPQAAGPTNGPPHAANRQQTQPVSAPAMQSNTPTPTPKVAPASKPPAAAGNWDDWGSAAPAAGTWGNQSSNLQANTQW